MPSPDEKCRPRFEVESLFTGEPQIPTLVDLGIDEPLSRRAIIAAARECVDVKFRHQGRLPQTGLDCVGLIRWPLVVLADVEEDFKAYGMMPAEPTVQAMMGRYFPTKFAEPEPGDILQMAIEGNMQHFAILTDNGNIIHAINGSPHKVVEHGYRHPWPSRCVGVFEYPGVEEWQP